MTKLKNWNCEKTQNSNRDKTQKPKLWQNSKMQIVLKHKNSNCDNSKAQIKINIKLWAILKTQIVAKLKYSNCEKKTKKSNLDKNLFVSKLQISNCEKTQKLKLFQNSNYDKSQFMRGKNKRVL